MKPSDGLDADWFAELRRQFLRLARRRVPEAVVEDLVQEALRIVVEKGITGPGELVDGHRPGAAFAFRVLRNTIGNHYQRARTRSGDVSLDAALGAADDAATPLEALAQTDAVAAVYSALDELARDDRACAQNLRRLAEGARAGELARTAGVEEAAFYRRIYRCRLKLRDLLRTKGILT